MEEQINKRRSLKWRVLVVASLICLMIGVAAHFIWERKRRNWIVSVPRTHQDYVSYQVSARKKANPERLISIEEFENNLKIQAAKNFVDTLLETHPSILDNLSHLRNPHLKFIVHPSAQSELDKYLADHDQDLELWRSAEREFIKSEMYSNMPDLVQISFIDKKYANGKLLRSRRVEADIAVAKCPSAGDDIREVSKFLVCMKNGGQVTSFNVRVERSEHHMLGQTA